MRRDADADVERIGERDLHDAAGEHKISAVGEVHVEVLAALHDPGALGGGLIGLHLVRGGALFGAGLQGRQSHAVHRDIGVCGILVQALAHHQHAFAMFVPARADEGDVRGQGYIAGDLFPDVVEIVFHGPDVVAAPGDGVGSGGGVIIDRAGMQNHADVPVAFENSDRGGALRQADGRRSANCQQAASRMGQPSRVFRSHKFGLQWADSRSCATNSPRPLFRIASNASSAR